MPVVSELDREKYRDLWRAVLYRAIEDLYTRDEAKNYADHLAWFDPSSDDFEMVCGFGEIDEAAVTRILEVWLKFKDKGLVKLIMLKEGILPPTEKDKTKHDFDFI